MTVKDFSSRAFNMQCHNMCNPPSLMRPGVKSLLGRGLKYCVRKPRPTNKVKNTINRLTRDLRLNWYFKYHPPDEEPGDGPSYIPGLYLNNQDWEPPACDEHEFEKGISTYKEALMTAQKRYNRSTPSNLTPRQ